MKVAAIQMVSVDDVAANLAQAAPLLDEAAREGATLALLPENFGYMGKRASDRYAVREQEGTGPQQDFLADSARRHRMIIIGGSVPIDCGDPARVKQTLLAYGADGKRIARYDKIHLFRFTHGSEDYDEARQISAGAVPVTLATPAGRVGLSICYDVRFPELYRSQGDLALIVVPSAFTARTGAAHWHLLLRARAVENQCYVLAAAQGGTHPGGRQTYGHSLLVDPWGEIVAERVEEGPGVAVGAIDPARIASVRESLPAFAHRTLR